VVFLESKEFTPEAREELVGRIRYAVSSTLGITPHDVILVRRGRLPRTSSGKLLRHGLEDLYQQYTHPEAPTEPTVE
jgi:acyl-coenzyme A synthetase/AMP-(fatty) acid ligase